MQGTEASIVPTLSFFGLGRFPPLLLSQDPPFFAHSPPLQGFRVFFFEFSTNQGKEGQGGGMLRWGGGWGCCKAVNLETVLQP